MAFDTLSEMASNGVASGLVLILGNIIIIGLEGLIVFIQGLRLEYYELFSKYFTGTGYEYNPFKINLKKERTFKVNR
jgi:V/A-type H+-transporting ATPase subunit I